TWSELDTHVAMVHSNTYTSPLAPENPLAGSLGSSMTPPAPLMIVHVPVPAAGTFPSSDVGPQTVISGPATAVGGSGVIVMTTSSVTEGQDAVGSVLSVRVTEPAAMSLAPGVYVAVSEAISSKVPSPAVVQ